MTLTCKHCGAVETREFMAPRMQSMRERQACFTCDFWLDQLAEPENALILPDFRHMRAVPNERGIGCGGRLHTFTLTDGTTFESRNVWHQGEIPAHMRSLFTINVSQVSE